MEVGIQQHFLERWKGDAEGDPGWQPEAERVLQGVRLATLIGVVSNTAAIPRRLGQDATRGELAEDKKRARSLEYQLGSALARWCEGEWYPDLDAYCDDPDLRREGAQVDWQEWLTAYAAGLMSEVSRIAASAAATGKRKQGNCMVRMLLNEGVQVHRVLGVSRSW